MIIRKISFGVSAVVILVGSGFATPPFAVESGLFNQDAAELGLTIAPDVKTVTVYTPTATSDHYSNGAVMIGFKGKLYCQWQSSAVHEDSSDTWVAYSIGEITIDAYGNQVEIWSAPKILAATMNNGYRTGGGWIVYKDTLIAFINEWPDNLNNPRGGLAYYRESIDGINWSELKPVLMKDGSQIQGIFEQDPHEYDGRLYNAAHMQPGLLATPIYTDDLSGRTGWIKPNFTNLDHSGNNSRELEPSLFKNGDGHIVMIFRDQNSTYTKLASISKDKGVTWSKAEQTNFPDSRAKQSAGNLPDGSVYFASNPRNINKRYPLSITLSDDGKTFTRAYNLRTEAELPARIYEGKAKTIGYSYPKSTIAGNYLYVVYSTNKEHIEYSRIPLQNICDYTPPINSDTLQVAEIDTLQATKIEPMHTTDSDTLQAVDAKTPQTTRIKDYTRFDTPRNVNHLYKIYDSKGRFTGSRQEKPTNIRKGLFVK